MEKVKILRLIYKFMAVRSIKEDQFKIQELQKNLELLNEKNDEVFKIIQ